MNVRRASERSTHPHWTRLITFLDPWLGGSFAPSQVARIHRVYRVVMPLYCAAGLLSLATVAMHDSVLRAAWSYQVAVTLATSMLLRRHADRAQRVMQACYGLLILGFLVRVTHAVAALAGTEGDLYSITAPVVAGAVVSHTIFVGDAAQRINRAMVLLVTAAAVSSLAMRPQVELQHVLCVAHFGMVALGISLLTEFLSDLQREHAHLRAQQATLERLALSDALTGLANRRACEAVLNRETSLAARHGGQLSVILLDVDQFKAINDRLGHAGGDETLKNVANLLRASVRSSDKATRWAGDEFMIVLPATPLDCAAAMAEHMRQTVAQNGVTISLGVGTLDPGNENVKSLLERVDRALYRAKAAGRNRAAIASQNPRAPAPEQPAPANTLALARTHLSDPSAVPG